MSTDIAGRPLLDANSAVRKYFRDEDWPGKTGIGGLINVTSMLVFLFNPAMVPMSVGFTALIYGYLIKVIRAYSADPDEPLPKWNGWGDMLLAGLAWISMQLLLLMFLGLLLVSTITLAIGHVILNPEQLVPVLSITLVAGFLAIIAINYYLSYLLVNYALSDRVGAGLDMWKVMKKSVLAPQRLLTAWMIATGLQMAAVIVPAMTLIGVFIIPSTFLGAQIISFILLAQAWDEKPVEPAPEPPAKST